MAAPPLQLSQAIHRFHTTALQVSPLPRCLRYNRRHPYLPSRRLYSICRHSVGSSLITLRGRHSDIDLVLADGSVELIVRQSPIIRRNL